MLEVEPELRAVAEELRQAQRCVGRRPCTMSPMRVAGTRILIASAFCVMPRGRRNSSRSISPGCVVTLCNFHPVAGLLIVIHVLQLVVIGDLNIVRSIVLPDKADAV